MYQGFMFTGTKIQSDRLGSISLAVVKNLFELTDKEGWADNWPKSFLPKDFLPNGRGDRGELAYGLVFLKSKLTGTT